MVEHLKNPAMSAIVSNILNTQKSRLHQWTPDKDDPVLFKVTILVHWNYQNVLLAADGEDGNGLQFAKVGTPIVSSNIASLKNR